jgi:thiol:disulfide interchange protein
MIKALRAILFVLLSLIFTNGIFAQMVQDNSKWTFEAKKKAGNRYDLIVHLKLPEKWHIYSFNPGGDGMELAPAITFGKNDHVKLSGKVKEQGKLISEKMDGIDGIVNMYKGSVDYIQQATINGNTTITGAYSYQICNDEMCLPPAKKSFSIVVGDQSGAGPATAVNTGAAVVKDSGATAVDTPKNSAVAAVHDTSKAAPADTINKTASTVSAGKGSDKKEMPLWLLFLIALGAGIAALVTPCVYSMIPITVSFFTKRSKTRREGIINATYYALSIIIIFTLLGVILSIAFGPTALYKLSTNWIANLFFFAMFVVFGISFLGAFEITLPSSWTSKTDAKAGLGSFSGIFFMALTLVIVSFSCTGPIVGPLVVVAGNGGIAGPAVGMFGFSLGLALPFALFAVFPGMLNKMATSGGWLNQVKVTLGFIELAFALKFLSNADLVKHWRLLDREIFIALWIVISVLLGMYLLGKFKLSHDDAPAKNVYGQEYVSIFKLFFAIISFTFALYLLPGMWGAPLSGLGQFIPPMGTQDFVVGEGGEAHAISAAQPLPGATQPTKYVAQMKIYEPNAVRKLGLVTYFDYDEALAAAKKLKKPVMLDFTGITCVNCRKMESQVWAQPEVIKLLKNDFIVVSLFCDATQVDLEKGDQYVSKSTNSNITTLGDKSLDIQINQFKANSQPFYFFIDENGNKLAEDGYGYDPDVQKFVRHLEQVKERYASGKH